MCVCVFVSCVCVFVSVCVSVCVCVRLSVFACVCVTLSLCVHAFFIRKLDEFLVLDFLNFFWQIVVLKLS